MKQLVALWLLMISIAACRGRSTADPVNEKEELQPLAYTLYTARSELFVEFKPLVVGQTSRFAVHLTKLADNFVPYTEGTITVSLIQGDKGLRNSAAAPGSPGIYRLALQPAQTGMGKLVFDLQTKDFRDQLIIDSVQVYADEATALSAQPANAEGNAISYPKEQAWKVAFANAPVQKETIFNVVKATGEILSAPGDEITVAAKWNGTVKFSGTANMIGSAVRAGQSMFSITGGEIPVEYVAATKEAARAELNTAQTEYNRASELVKDKLITQGEFQAAKLRLRNAQITLNNLNRNYSAGGKTVTAPITGFVKNIAVSEGQYVSAGQPLATITKNQRLVLRADVSLKHADRISTIREANFTIVQNKLNYNTKTLNGKLLSIAKTTGGNTPYLPVYFQIDSRPGLLPGSFAEVYLKTDPIYNALVIPASALVEDQGIFYVYVQTGGELFQKRELQLGANDGEKVQVISGVTEGERIVTKGAYQIKLAQASGAFPAHGHEH